MTTQPGRRSASGGRGGVTSTAVLGVLLPALTLGVLLLVQPHEPVDSARPPEPTTLKSASVACPSALAGEGCRPARAAARAEAPRRSGRGAARRGRRST